MDRNEKEAVERTISARIHSAKHLHLFAGIGIGVLLDYIIRHEGMSVNVQGEPIRQRGGLIREASYTVGVFSHMEQKGWHEASDVNMALTIAGAQALNVLAYKPKKWAPCTREKVKSGQSWEVGKVWAPEGDER